MVAKYSGRENAIEYALSTKNSAKMALFGIFTNKLILKKCHFPPKMALKMPTWQPLRGKWSMLEFSQR